MTRSRRAAIVLAAGVAIAVTTTDSRAQLAQASPDQEGMRDMENMRGRRGAHDGMGPIGHMHGMMMHRMMRRSPKESAVKSGWPGEPELSPKRSLS